MSTGYGIEIEFDRKTLYVLCDGRSLLEVSRGDDSAMERVADILAEKKLNDQAAQVRKILYGR